MIIRRSSKGNKKIFNSDGTVDEETNNYD